MTSSALLPCALGDGHFRGPVLEGSVQSGAAIYPRASSLR